MGFWLSALIAKEWSQRDELEMAELPPSRPSSLSQCFPNFNATRCSDVNNTQILECFRSFSLSSHQFACSRESQVAGV